jgi:hypothetical protein
VRPSSAAFRFRESITFSRTTPLCASNGSAQRIVVSSLGRASSPRTQICALLALGCARSLHVALVSADDLGGPQLLELLQICGEPLLAIEVEGLRDAGL